MNAQTEAQFTAAVREYAMLCGWRYYHTHDSRRSDPGFPDCVLVRGERLIFAELKLDKARSKPTEAQEAWLTALALLPTPWVRVCVWRPSDWPSIEEMLR